MRLMLVLFILWPLLELWLLMKVGAEIGALAAVALVVLAAVIGLAVLRSAGGQTLSMAQLRLRQRTSPVPALVDGFLLTVAGILLVLPGLISDGVAVVLLIKPLRRLLSRRWGRNAAVAAGPQAQGSVDLEPGRPDQPVVIEGEYRREP